MTRLHVSQPGNHLSCPTKGIPEWRRFTPPCQALLLLGMPLLGVLPLQDPAGEWSAVFAAPGDVRDVMGTFPCAQATGIWAQLQRTKTLVCEPHGTGEAFDSAMKTYYDAIAEGRGAIFFAICRGKVSLAEAVSPSMVYSAGLMLGRAPASARMKLMLSVLPGIGCNSLTISQGLSLLPVAKASVLLLCHEDLTYLTYLI